MWIAAIAGWVWYHAGIYGATVAITAQLVDLITYFYLMRAAITSAYSKLLCACMHILAALWMLAQLGSFSYFLVQGFALDPLFALDSYDEIIPTLMHVFSPILLMGGMGIFALAWLAVCWHMGRAQYNLVRYAWLAPIAIAYWVSFDSLGLAQASFPFMFFSARMEGNDEGKISQFKNVGVVTQNLGAFHSEDGAPVFILQLESGNALALNGRATPEKAFTAKQLMPQIYAAHEQGVLVPHMWGASVQTHRGQGSILCSAVLDIFQGISYMPKAPQNCLPAMLKADGYETFFASAYTDGSFYNTQYFMPAIGFNEAHFADAMQPGDQQWSWGYDDCTFYDRYFDYLKTHFDKRMNTRFMAFFSVVANHSPFEHKKGYEAYEPFATPVNLAEQYLDSFAMQDHCVARFLEKVEPYRDRAHVIIVADHSWPVGVNDSKHNEKGATSDNFMIPFLYLPPLGKKADYEHGTIINKAVGQPDIFPTILELLSGKHYSNSFAGLLKRHSDTPSKELSAEDYDDCQVMTQPYDGTQVAVARDMQKYTYNLMSHQVAFSQLDKDFYESPQHRSPVSMSYSQFLDHYLCARDKYWLPKLPGQTGAVPLFSN